MAGLILLAASGLAREVLASLRSSGAHEVLGFLDDDPALAGTMLDGVPVLGRIEDAVKFPRAQFLACAGKGASRAHIVDRLGALGIAGDRYVTVVDDAAVVAPGCLVGNGSILLANVVLTAGVELGDHVVAMPQVTFTHDDRAGDFSTFTTGVSLGGSVQVGRFAYLGMNSSVRERCTIGEGATVGMGSAVLTDVPDGETWVGVPARALGAGKTIELATIMGEK
ncbi:MAG: NeuD/PglB/VioB family sugar acetyltransferase [Specibacter sp.]